MPLDGQQPSCLIRLAEWESRSPASDPALRGLSLAGDERSLRLAEVLRRRVDIRPGYEGVEIEASSFVGHVDVGPLRIAIEPKLPSLPLTRLLRYAYGLGDIAILEETIAPAAEYGFQDLLIAMLASEIEGILRRGLSRRYLPKHEKLDSPRGHILVDQLIREGGIQDARLPCRHYERSADWHLNQVLRSGLALAARLTEDAGLRRRIHKLDTSFGQVRAGLILHTADVDRAERELTRLTATSRPALTLIRLLLGGCGLELSEHKQRVRMPGFLFDMNVFFQSLLSRFLREHLVESQVIDEFTIRELFSVEDARSGRRTPRPRPDFALLHADKPQGFLDAKYRDLWTRSLPAEWLYQMSIYALASTSRRASVLLYATMSPDAREERITIHPPSMRTGERINAHVILRPVPLLFLAEMLRLGQAGDRLAERQAFAASLVANTFSAR